MDKNHSFLCIYSQVQTFAPSTVYLAVSWLALYIPPNLVSSSGLGCLVFKNLPTYSSYISPSFDETVIMQFLSYSYFFCQKIHFSFSSNNLIYQGGQYEPSSHVTNNLHSLIFLQFWIKKKEGLEWGQKYHDIKMCR